jgi:hypothetical protein
VVTPEQYKSSLGSAIGPLEAALRKVDKAGSKADLETALGTASGAAGTAADSLDSTKTPKAAATAHADLVRALRSLSTDLGTVKDDKSLCTTGSARVRLGKTGSNNSVPTASKALGDLGYPVKLGMPRTEKEQNRRLGNGTVIKNGGRGGLGKLKLRNGSGSDTVISLARGKQTVLSVYIRRSENVDLSNFTDGTYTVYFATGQDWDSRQRTFSRGCAYEKFDDPAKFRTVRVSGGTQYSILTFSLQKTVGGNATTSEVPPGDFPS